MELSKYIINKYVSDLEGSNSEKLNALKEHLKSQNVNFKDYEDIGLVLLFTDYKQTVKSDFERECRSMILDRETLQIVSYSCNDPICNADATHYLLNQEKQLEQRICQCYEGPLIHVFFFKGTWYFSTRKCLDSCDSVWKGDKSHYQMFQECVAKLGVENLTDSLNKEYNYYFVLMHHENINIVDYSSKFGENYAKLALAIIRKQSDQQEVDIYDTSALEKVFPIEFVGESKIIIPEIYTDMTSLETENNKGVIDVPAKNEGLLIKVYDPEKEKNIILKFQTTDYQFGQAVGSNSNIYLSLLWLYQNNKLDHFLKNFKNFESFRKIVNPTNTTESFDTIGMVDAVFKVITSEAYELLKILWDIKTGAHKNKELYNYIPKEMKDLMFAIRGIYFSKKAEYITNKKNTTNGSKVPRSVLKINDIYELMKNYDLAKLEALLKARRLMINLVNKEKEDPIIQKYKGVSNKCDKVLMKLAAIYTSKLFPDLTSDDVYEDWKNQDSEESHGSTGQGQDQDQVEVV